MEGDTTRRPHGRLPRCDATNRHGQRCGRPAGWGPDHVGQGKCRNHGGASPIKHGRYSRITRDTIRQLYEQYEHDPDPLNLLPDLAMCRAILHDFIERYERWRAAFLDWHASFGSGDEGRPASAKPRQVLDIADARNTLLAIAKIVETIERIRGNISRAELLRVMGEMGRVIEVRVEDERVRKQIVEDWLAIQLG